MNGFLPEWLLALALTLFVIDIFTDEEGIVSWCGVISIATWATWRVGAPLVWSVLVFIAAFFLAGAAWYWLFRGFVGRPIRNLLQKNAAVEAVSAIKGAKGSLHLVEGRVFFRWNGDELWPVANPPAGAVEGQEAVAHELKDGAVRLKE